MEYFDFLNRIIEDGIAAARADYKDKDNEPKLQGSVEGFEACRERTPFELLELLGEAHRETKQAFKNKIQPEKYWRVRCYELEIEWVCNCISILLRNSGQPVIVPPTARAALKVAEILV